MNDGADDDAGDDEDDQDDKDDFLHRCFLANAFLRWRRGVWSARAGVRIESAGLHTPEQPVWFPAVPERCQATASAPCGWQVS